MRLILQALATKLPELGATGVLVFLVLRLWDAARGDRSDYRTALDAAETRHATELERVRTVHQQEIDALRASVGELTRRVEQLNVALDEERSARRRAEDKADAGRRGGEPM